MQRLILSLAFIFFISCSNKKYDHPRILIETEAGEIEAELYPDKAPKTVAAITSYIDSGYYKKSSFYRVLREEDDVAGINTGLIQAGTWPEKKNVPGIEHEPTSQTGLSHTNGTLSLARTQPGTASTEFFICLGDQKQFDAGNSRTADTAGFAAFGRVVKGMDVVRAIQKRPMNGDHFKKRILIKNIILR